MPELRFNELTYRLEWKGGEVEDAILHLARIGLEQAGLTTIYKQNVIDAIETVARRYAYHPVQDYLKGLSWDGERRMRAAIDSRTRNHTDAPSPLIPKQTDLPPAGPSSITRVCRWSTKGRAVPRNTDLGGDSVAIQE